MLLVPSALPKISRRRALVSAAAVAVLGVTAAGCADPPPSPDLADLAAQLDRARSDSKLASDAAAAQPPQSAQARALTTVASERSKHAQALTDELVRMAGTKAPTAQPSASSTTTPTSGAPAPAPTVADVIGALKQSGQEATTLAARLSGYRAGLVGSIAAACVAAYTVALGGAQ
ncbi:hypothetical protein [Mycolicibacterium brisbanense]|uniref:hypothetical protein n=1 Tax=Mycolicibacterium brisbanense TaxID=146020 RepID=UPI000B045284|nr:hypothetical protein [Mycolicibacterium brisbanense]MCV7157342.1 hypothetical protein [Mycolicibacterium brisbanense]